MDPVTPNSELGTYTNFVNLMDMCGIAVPTGPRSDGRPGSVTILARAGQDALAASVGGDIAGRTGGSDRARGACHGLRRGSHAARDGGCVGWRHMAGLPLNAQVTARGGRFLRAAKTAPDYRLYLLPGGPPLRPGLLRVGAGQGEAIACELWAIPLDAVGTFLAAIPAPLGLGRVRLDDGSGRDMVFLRSRRVLPVRRTLLARVAGAGGWPTSPEAASCKAAGCRVTGLNGASDASLPPLRRSPGKQLDPARQTVEFYWLGSSATVHAQLRCAKRGWASSGASIAAPAATRCLSPLEDRQVILCLRLQLKASRTRGRALPPISRARSGLFIKSVIAVTNPSITCVSPSGSMRIPSTAVADDIEGRHPIVSQSSGTPAAEGFHTDIAASLSRDGRSCAVTWDRGP